MSRSDLAQQVLCTLFGRDGGTFGTCRLWISTCRFGHPDKGPMRMITTSPQVAQKANKRCQSRQRHPTLDTDARIQDSTGWAATLCKAILQAREDQIHEDQHNTTAHPREGKFCDDITDEKLDMKKVGRRSTGGDEIFRKHARVQGMYRTRKRSKERDEDQDA